MLNSHYSDMLHALSGRDVKYMLVGGYALAAYGHPRVTLDFDLFVEASPANAEKLYAALADFGAPLAFGNVTPLDFAKNGTIYQIGVEPCRIDIINEIAGVCFSDAYLRARIIDFNGLPVRVISPEDLLTNKKAAGRHKDLADVEILEKMLKTQDTPNP